MHTLREPNLGDVERIQVLLAERGIYISQRDSDMRRGDGPIAELPISEPSR